MKLTNRFGIGVIGLCALLLLGSPIYAGTWTTNGGSCTVDDESVGRVKLFSGLQHKGGETGKIVTRCNIVDVEGDDEWGALSITYRDPDGTGNRFVVRAVLVTVDQFDGSLGVIRRFSSNEFSSKFRERGTVAFDHNFDFVANAYYLYVTLWRLDTGDVPSFYRAEIGPR